MHEASQSETNGFLTLTYSDENLPHGNTPTLDLGDLQKFNKRARKARGPYRYYAVGEYGGQTLRPHYHLITFGWLPKFTSQVTERAYQSNELDELWGLGNATVGEVTPASAAYCAQYCMKKLTKKQAWIEGKCPEFSVQSNGIGREWLRKYAGDLDRGFMVFNGRKVRIPRYYKEKKGDLDPEWYLLQQLKSRARRREEDPLEITPMQLERREIIHASKRGLSQKSHREPDKFL